jgi:hypothetical protein
VQIFLAQAGQSLEYELKRTNRRSGTYRLKVCEGKLTIYAPFDCPLSIIEEGLRAKGTWLLEKLALSRKRLAENRKDSIFYRGLSYPLQLKKAAQTRVLVENYFLIETPSFEPYIIQNILENWFKRQAAIQIKPRVTEWAKKVGVFPNKVTFRNQKTRWGSCSTLGNINLNIRLLMAPPQIIDYVIVHELCHLLEPNHSSSYWQHVARYMPEYQKARAWLTNHGRSLSFNVGLPRRQPAEADK